MNNKYEFRDLLSHYFFNLSRIRYDLDKKELIYDEAKKLLYQNISWMHEIKRYAYSKEDLYEEIKDKRVLNRKEFLLPEDKRCPGCIDGKPFYVIKYRNIMIPVYDDDYGQQDFAIVLGETVSGGSYNFCAAEEFCDCLDRKLEYQYLENKYDMKAEIDALYPEWKKK